MQQLPPPLFAFALALLALTPENAKKKDRRPSPGRAPVERVAQLVGNCAVRRLNAPGPMPRRKVLVYMRQLAAHGVFDTWDVRAGEVFWTWSADLHNAMGAYGDFVKVPKGLLWDSTLTGVEKLVYVALRYGQHFGDTQGWPKSGELRLVISQDRFLREWTGLAQSTISETLTRLEASGLIHLEGTRLGQATALRFLSATVRYCWQDADVGRRRLVPLYVPFDQDEVHYRRRGLVADARRTGQWNRGYPEQWWTTVVEGRLPRLLDHCDCVSHPDPPTGPEDGGRLGADGTAPV